MAYRWRIAFIWRSFSNPILWQALVDSGAVTPAREPNWLKMKTLCETFQKKQTAFERWLLSAYDVETLSQKLERQVASSTERQRCQAGALVPAGLASYANRRRSGLRRKSMPEKFLKKHCMDSKPP